MKNSSASGNSAGTRIRMTFFVMLGILAGVSSSQGDDGVPVSTMSFHSARLVTVPTGQVANQSDSNSPGAGLSQAGFSPLGVRVNRASFQQRITEIPPQVNHVWRRTPDGWKQVPLKPLPFVHAMEIPEQRPRIHPFSVASLTLLLSLAAMAWASNEWDWARFVGDGDQS